MENMIQAVIIIMFLAFLYIIFCRKPKIKTIKAPTVKQVKRKKKHARMIRKIKRKFKIPYRGKTEIIEYSKTRPYIEHAWNEIEH